MIRFQQIVADVLSGLGMPLELNKEKVETEQNGSSTEEYALYFPPLQTELNNSVIWSRER